MAALKRENREISVDPFLPSILNALSIASKNEESPLDNELINGKPEEFA